MLSATSCQVPSLKIANQWSQVQVVVPKPWQVHVPLGLVLSASWYRPMARP